MRIRIVFSKTEAMRYTSHLDLQRTWERTLRRAGLPVAYSQGYNPRPRIQLAAALPLGITSQCEIIDVWLENAELSLTEIENKLHLTVPPGLTITEIGDVNPTAPALQNSVKQAEYEVVLLDTAPDLSIRIRALLAESSLIRQRRGKIYDLRPLIGWLKELPEDGQNRQRLMMGLSAAEGKTGRPEEVLSALNILPERSRIQRNRLLFD